MMTKKIMLVSVIIILVAVSLISALTEPKIYYKLNLNYDNRKISVDSIEIKFFDEDLVDRSGTYSVSIFDFNNKTIKNVYFDVPNKVLVDNIDPETRQIIGGGWVELNKTEFELYVPYYENAKEIVIYNENSEEVARNDVNIYSKQRKDFRKADEETKKYYQIKLEEESLLLKYWWVLIMILVLVLLFYFLKRKK